MYSEFDSITTEFFKPDLDFLRWIKNEIGDAVFADIGCGKGHISAALSKLGAKGMGVDLHPHFEWEKIRNEAMREGRSLHFINLDATKENGLVHKMLQSPHAETVLLFCRPCHSNFVEKTIDLANSGTKIIYITLPGNEVKYNDLGKYFDHSKKVDHAGTSVDNEVVYVFNKA